ncbi:MAG: A/G-specific adenine glycosylase [Gemmatimonadetes bacterium]|nr:A/G-specific adenine glycosylase [Gemmatimonadota bacterium]
MQRTLTDGDIAAIRTALLVFFDAHARKLPWRSTRDPYAVWVSEVMAQQTRVETVIPYYERWLSRFPDIVTLAEAPVDDVLKAWEGLGYYSRARNIHAAARLLRDHHRCAVPDSYEELRTLPGIGEYTAGAVSSIAFGVRRPAVDGNVRRVLARLLDHPSPSSSLLREVAGSLVPHNRPGDFNQALMELGATICTPRSPQCARCPIENQCAARDAGTQQQRPRPKARKALPVIEFATAVVRDGTGRLLIMRRPAHGLLAGMWSFPAVELAAGDDPAAAALAIARDIVALPTGAAEPGSAEPASRPIGTVEHVFSHRRERYHCYMIETSGRSTARDDIAWIADTDSTRALPRAQQRIRALATGRR